MRLERLPLRYARGGPWVLQDVDLELAPGDVVEVTGHNGAGKSSLLRIAAGVLRPTSGRVRGRPTVVGWAPERFDVGLALTVGSYLAAHAAMRGLSGSAAGSAIDRELDRWHAEPLRDTRLAELSKGSAQKVGLMQALLVEPQLLVLDEPWSGLDATARAALPGVVTQVAAAGGRVLITDHQRHAAQLPLTTRWHAAAGIVRPSALEPGEPERDAVVRVRLRSTDAARLVDRLRREGYDVSTEAGLATPGGAPTAPAPGSPASLETGT